MQCVHGMTVCRTMSGVVFVGIVGPKMHMPHSRYLNFFLGRSQPLKSYFISGVALVSATLRVGSFVEVYIGPTQKYQEEEKGEDHWALSIFDQTFYGRDFLNFGH